MRSITSLVTILSCLIFSQQSLQADDLKPAPQPSLNSSATIPTQASEKRSESSMEAEEEEDEEDKDDFNDKEEEDDEDDKDEKTSPVNPTVPNTTSNAKPITSSNQNDTLRKPVEEAKEQEKKLQDSSMKQSLVNKTTKPAPVASAPAAKKQPFTAFTGRIAKNKVRLRLQPNFESLTLQEMNKDQLVVVLDETEDFYAIQPSQEYKAYIFRTYVLDNVIEGTRVNVRLKPDLDAPVIAQLNSGDRVDGKIYSQNNKWLEISVPASARFYIAKEYVENAGDAGFMARTEKRKDEVYRLLTTTKTVSDIEIQKSFHQINLEGIIANYKKIILDYKDFPEVSNKAQEYLTALQNDYTNKKLAHLEQKTQQSNQLERQNQELSKELQEQKTKLSQLEQDKLNNQFIAVNEPMPNKLYAQPTQTPYNMASWMPVENALFIDWSRETNNDNPATFYQEQMDNSFVLKGIVDPYTRPVKNRPGDFMLVNSGSKLPIAFLYSTQLNLQNYVGQEVTIRVAPRNNFNYAFPAYFVLSIE